MAQLLTYVFTEKFKKQFKKLPQTLKTRFNVIEDEIQFLTIGPHDEGLGKK